VSDTIKLSAPETRGFWEIPVLYEDEHLLALNKPPLLLSSPDRYDPARPNLIKLLHRDIERGAPWASKRSLRYLMNAHRLDFETSGVMLLANLGDTVAEFAGIGAALAIFGVPIWLSSALAALAILFLLSRANFRRIQFVFLAVGIGTSLAYAISAVLAHPDWGKALSHTVVPHGSITSLYLLAVMGTKTPLKSQLNNFYLWEL